MDNKLNNKLEQIFNKQINYLGYMVEATSYELVYLNENLKDKLSFNDELYKGKNCYEVIHNYSSPCTHCVKNELSLNKEHNSYKYNNKSHMRFSTRESLENIDGKLTFVSTSYDITTEYNKIETLINDTNHNNTVIECAKTLLDRDNMEDTMTRLLEIICQYYDAELSLLYERNNSTKVSQVEYFYSIPSVEKIKKEDIKSFNYEAIPAWTQALQKSPYIFLKSTDENLHLYNYPELFLKKEDSNLVIVPLKNNSTILGAIEVKDVKKNMDNFDLLTIISAFVVNNMEIISSKTELEQTVSALFIRNSFNQIILDCVQNLLDNKDDDLAVERLLFTISTHFSAQGTYILQRDSKNLSSFVNEHTFASNESDVYNSLCDISFDEMLKWYNNFEYKGLAYFGNAIENISIISPDSPELEILKLNNIASFAISPITKNDTITGFIFLYNLTQNTNDMSLLSIVTAFLVNHIIKNELVQNLEFLSYTDKLTGLYNRNYYMTFVDRLRNSAKNSIGIIFADVNGLKRANDNFGHELGDTLIQWCGNFFKKLGGQDVFRIGGDEFICFFEGIEEEDFDNKVDKINENLYNYGDVHVSIGHIWSDNSKDIEELIKESDELMYKQKQEYYAKKKNDRRARAEELNDFQRSIINLRSELI